MKLVVRGISEDAPVIRRPCIINNKSGTSSSDVGLCYPPDFFELDKNNPLIGL